VEPDPIPTYMRLIPSEPLSRLEDYIAAGDGEGLATALAMEPGEVIAEVADSGSRGRGGAGFPTGTKWGAVLQAAEEITSRPRLMVNGAEGEPGTYKDRLLLTMNPFAVLEGLIIAGYALGTDHAQRLRQAIDELVAAGREQTDLVQVVEGPDEYLFGEKTGLLEVIEGNQPLPRWLPPFQQGLFASTEHAHPTAVNNVETLANVPRILAEGANSFRSVGTAESPGASSGLAVPWPTVKRAGECTRGRPRRRSGRRAPNRTRRTRDRASMPDRPPGPVRG
jgi:NADH-quinone oxidoreductase subunit F